MRAFFAIAICIGVFGNPVHGQSLDAEYNELAEGFVADLMDKLKDPRSVQLRSVKVVQLSATAKPFVCAEVNAKNSYGGYTGFKLYTGDSRSIRTQDDYDDPILADIWPRIANSCKNGPFVYVLSDSEEDQTKVPIEISPSLAKKLEAYALLNDLPDGNVAAEILLQEKLGD